MTRSLESTDYKGRVEQEGVLTNCKEELAALVTLFLKYVKGNYIFFPCPLSLSWTKGVLSRLEKMLSSNKTVKLCNSMYYGIWKYHYCRLLKKKGWTKNLAAVTGCTSDRIDDPSRFLHRNLFSGFFKGAPIFSPFIFLFTLSEVALFHRSLLYSGSESR